MQKHDAKRVAIIIEAVMESRLRQALESSGVSGYSVLPVLGGSGRSGGWSRDDTFTRGGGMVQVVCIIRPDRLDPLLDAAFEVVDSHIGVVSISDCQVLRVLCCSPAGNSKSEQSCLRPSCCCMRSPYRGATLESEMTA